MANLDVALPKEIESWRDELALSAAAENPGVSPHEIECAVQRFIEGLICLRMLEDLGAEPQGQLQAALAGPGISDRVLAIFQHCRHRYHSGLFGCRSQHRCGETSGEVPHPLVIDDGPLGRIVSRLDSPRETSFSALPAEFLGEVYENFLDQVSQPSEGRPALAAKKSRLRRNSGVYYTPRAILDYVVENTIGMLLNQTVRPGAPGARSTTEASGLRILDPACGSGYFLIAAYRYLLHWHRNAYMADSPQRHARGDAPVLHRGTDGEWHLTAAERERILVDHLYGVDIDPHAVEITKFSLLLELLRNPAEYADARAPSCAGAAEIGDRLRTTSHRSSGQTTIGCRAGPLFPQHLPDLTGNIRCGNSLLGRDLSHAEPVNPHTATQKQRVSGFDWPREFPRIARCGGFDAVIGNPPWGQKGVVLDAGEKRFLRERYQSLAGIFDLFRPFVERGIRLLRQGGVCGMVLPDILLLKNYQETRLFMLKNLALTDIRWWGMAFQDAVIDAVTVIGRRAPAADGHLVRARVDDPNELLDQEIPQSDFLANPRYTFNLHLTRQKRTALASLARLPRIGDFFEIHEGIHSGNMRSELFVDSPLDESCRPMYFGREEIVRYRLQWNGRFVRLAAVPEMRTNGKYANLGRTAWHERPKVLVRRTGDHVMAAVDRHGYYASNNFFLLFPKTDCSLDLDGLGALLNSRFITWFFRAIEPRKGRAFSELKIKHLRDFPLPAAVTEPCGCVELNALGRRCASAVKRAAVARSSKTLAVCDRILRRVEDRVDSLIGWKAEEP